MVRGLPERLKALRMTRGISQRAVARHLDVSPSIISSYETGERTPSTENLLSLSVLYNCSTDYLLGRDPNARTASINVDGLSVEQIQLLQALISTMRK